MALDEPNDKDAIFDHQDYTIMVDPQTRDIVDQSGGLTIDYVDQAHQRGYLLQLNQAGGACGDGGGCSGCG
jgi:Fe-S cluster assembly iron-binding protein IscA